MQWKQGDSSRFVAKIPGEIAIKAVITVHVESIVSEILANGISIRKWAIPLEEGIDKAKQRIEGILNQLAAGIWEG